MVFKWLSRKAWLLTTTFVITFLFSPKKGGRSKGEWVAKSVQKWCLSAQSFK